MNRRNTVLLLILTASFLTATYLSMHRSPSSSRLPDLPEFGYPDVIPLAAAVEQFNRRSLTDSIGRSEVPLTTSELISFLTYSAFTSNELNEETKDLYKTIIKTGLLPKGSLLKSFTRFTASDEPQVSRSVRVWQISLDTNLDRAAAVRPDQRGRLDLRGLNIRSDTVRLRFLNVEPQA